MSNDRICCWWKSKFLVQCFLFHICKYVMTDLFAFGDWFVAIARINACMIINIYAHFDQNSNDKSNKRKCHWKHRMLIVLPQVLCVLCVCARFFSASFLFYFLAHLECLRWFMWHLWHIFNACTLKFELVFSGFVNVFIRELNYELWHFTVEHDKPT